MTQASATPARPRRSGSTSSTRRRERGQRRVGSLPSASGPTDTAGVAPSSRPPRRRRLPRRRRARSAPRAGDRPSVRREGRGGCRCPRARGRDPGETRSPRDCEKDRVGHRTPAGRRAAAARHLRLHSRPWQAAREFAVDSRTLPAVAPSFRSKATWTWRLRRRSKRALVQAGFERRTGHRPHRLHVSRLVSGSRPRLRGSRLRSRGRKPRARRPRPGHPAGSRDLGSDTMLPVHDTLDAAL